MSQAAVAFVFPGQGSQFIGMGRELATLSEAHQVFAQADEALGFSLSRLCFEGPEADLNDTINTQPAIVTHSVAALRVIESKTNLKEQLGMVAGHSLGEFSALVCAGALSFSDALRLVRERGRLMKQAGQQHPGAMAALLGLDRALVDQVCSEASQATGQPVQVANDNCPGQIVISGDRAALEKATELAKAQRAKVRPLAVSIAAHSPFMAGAAQEFRAVLESAQWTEPRIPVIANATARPATRGDVVDLLVAQLTSPVRWTESVQFMIGKGVTRFVELGPKDVLCGLVKRIDAAVAVNAVGKPEDLAAFADR
jgi:[acyl-carrier-protein] S-malonyltransferase